MTTLANARTFAEAMDALEADIAFEQAAGKRYEPPSADLQRYLAAVRIARAFHHRTVERVEHELFESMAASENQDLALIGRAALSGEYGQLAI